jgi:hypothetical protein
MADKSPRQHTSKKAGKSLKEKRAEKHAKADAENKIEIVPLGSPRIARTFPTRTEGVGYENSIMPPSCT